jgi:hypothetical protein
MAQAVRRDVCSTWFSATTSRHAAVPSGSRGFEYKNNYTTSRVQIKILKLDIADGVLYSARAQAHAHTHTHTHTHTRTHTHTVKKKSGSAVKSFINSEGSPVS